jgi:hypothetical protein
MMTGTFRDRDSAERAYQSLLDHGYTRDEISVLMSDDARKTHFPAGTKTVIEKGSKAAEGGLTGVAIGGTAGAIFGVLAAAGTLVLPGFGLVIAGPVAAGLAGFGAGGAAGGLLGALIGAGIPEERARHYETDLRTGGIVLAVTPRSEADVERLDREWREYRAENIFY